MGDVPDGFTKARLGVLPLGTVNVFARELGIPSSQMLPGRCCAAETKNRLISRSLRMAKENNKSALTSRNLPARDLDSRAIELVDWPTKKMIGPLAYVVAGLKAMREEQNRIIVSDGAHTVSGQLVLVGNGRLYGGSYRIFPTADFCDGKLDVCVFPQVNWPTLFRCGISILLRGRLPEAKVVRLRAASFSFIGKSSTRFEVDGELAGKLPARFSVQPLALRVLVPEFFPGAAPGPNPQPTGAFSRPRQDC
jgi:diacylglycerol kinase (ATP)